jgi:ribosomal protein S18 acetylase RimI-like enzyme
VNDVGPEGDVPAGAPGRGVPPLRFRAAAPGDATLVHGLYRDTPGYFEMLSIPLPSEREVRVELEAAAADRRRRCELILDGGAGLHAAPLGYLDVTLDYLEPGDATVNLLLVRGALQGRGIGSAAVRALEARLTGRVRRVLASVYGRNAGAERFWRGLGYAFAIDAGPVLEWYAKELAEPVAAGAHGAPRRGA